MDDTDRRIVALLREDARRSFKNIGDHVHLSAPAVKRRVDRLERDGGFAAIPRSSIPRPTAGARRRSWISTARAACRALGDQAGGRGRAGGRLGAHRGRRGERAAARDGRRHEGPGGRARAHPSARWDLPDGHRGGAVHPVRALTTEAALHRFGRRSSASGRPLVGQSGGRPGAEPVVAGAVERQNRARHVVAPARPDRPRARRTPRRAEPLKRHGAGDAFDHRTRILGHQRVGGKVAGGRGQPDPEAGPFDREHARQVLDRCARGRRVGQRPAGRDEARASRSRSCRPGRRGPRPA